MNHIKNALIVFVGMSLITLAVTVLVPSLTRGQKSTSDAATPTANVKVVNTTAEPVPIAGTVNLSNPGANPLPVRDVNNPAYQPFQTEAVFFFTQGHDVVSGTLPVTVPAGKRLVVEHASAHVQLPVGQRMNIWVSAGPNADEFTRIWLVVTWQMTNELGNEDTLVASQPLRLYAQNGDRVQVAGFRSSSIGGGQVIFDIAGHFVDLQ